MLMLKLKQRIIEVSFLCTVIVLSAGCGQISSAIKSAALNGSSLNNHISVSSSGIATTNQCVPLILGLQDSNNQVINSSSLLSVSVTGASASEIFSDSSCSVAETLPVVWSLGASSKVVYFKPSLAQIYFLQISDVASAYIGAFQTINVSSSAATVTLRLALTGVSSLLSGQCKTYVVSLVDSNGATQTRSGATSVNLGGAGTGVFTAGTNCTGGAVTSVSIPSASSLISFSFKDTAAENLVFTADTGTGSTISSTFYSVQVQSGAAYLPSQFAISGSASATAGACSGPVQVRTLDSFNNAAISATDSAFTLVGNLGFQAYSDSSCVTPLISPKISSGTSAMNFYYKTTSGGTLTISADDGGALLATSLTVAMSASVGGSATKLAVVGPTSLVVGSCSSAFLVKSQDGSSLDYAMNSATTVTLTGKGAGNFYSDSLCSTAISTLNFASGDSSKAFYFQTNAVGTLVFNAAPSNALTPGSLSLNVVPGVASKLAVSGPTNINLGDCRAYLVSSQDANNFASAVVSASPINLTGAGSGAFYSDSACSIATSTVTLNSGQSSTVFYYKASAGSTPVLSADNSGALTTGTLNITVAALPATKVVMSRPVLKAGVCTGTTVTLKDVLDGAVLTSSVVTVNLAKTNAAIFFSASNCNGGSAITTTTVSAGQSSSLVYILDNTAEATTLTASASGLTSDTWAATVSPNSPAQLLLSGSASFNAGACQAYTINIEDSQGNLSPLAASNLLSFTGAGSGHFSQSGDCSTVNSTLTLGAGSNQGVIYFTDSVAESLTLHVSASGLTAGSQALVVNSTGAVKMLWSITTSTPVVGVCVTGSLQIQDALNNPVNQASAATINLTGLSSGQVFTSANCTAGAVTSLTVPLGQNSVSFSFKDTVAESLTVQATSTGLTASNQNLAISAGSPSKLTLSGPAAVVAGDCTAYDLRSEDSYGNLSVVGTSTTVNFSGLSSGKFYSDAACSIQIASSSLTTGQMLKTIFLKDSTAENLTIGASGGAFTAASKSVSVSALAAVKLAITGASSAAVQTCTNFTLQVQDSLNNSVNQASSITVNLIGQSNGLFYSDAGCTTSASAITISAGTSSKVFGFKSNVSESLTFTAQSSGLVDGSKSFVSNPLAPTKLVLAGVTSISAGVCSGYNVSVEDPINNLSPTGAAKTLIFTGGGDGNFYVDSNCNTSMTTFALSSTLTSVNFYYKGNSAQSLTLNVDDTGLPYLTAATLAVTVNASASAGSSPSKLLLAGASTVNLNTCAAFAVIVNDASGTPANVSSNLSVSLTGNSTGGFYSDAGCSAPVSSVTVSSGANNAPFYFRTSTAGSFLFMSMASGLSMSTLSVTVNPAAGGGGGGGNFVPIKLLVSGPASVLSNSCGGQFTVSVADASNNVATVAVAETITLTNGAGNGTFYSDATCLSPITTLNFGVGTSQQTFYFKDAQAESVSLQAYSSDLVYGSFSVQVQASGRLNLSLASSASSVWQNFIYRNRGTISDRTVILQNVGLTQTNAVTLFTPSLSGIFSFRGGSFPGQGGTCVNNSVLLPNQQCTVVVRFQPTSATSFSDNLEMTYTVGTSNLQVNLPLSGDANTNLIPMAVAAGGNHTCVTLTDMSTKCFGLNSTGQLGVGNTTNYGVSSQDVEKLSWTPFAQFATQITAGAAHSCALMTDGSVICWGDNTYGQLGTGNTASIGAQPSDLANSAYTFVSLGTGKTATKITAGDYHTCALLQDGTAKCWGFNLYGQLGQGDNVNRGAAAADMGDNLLALDFGVGQTVVDISSGSNHNCVVLKGGQLKCWGRNIFGQLGVGSTADMGDNPNEMGTNLSPVSLASGATVLSVGAGGNHTCAILTVPSVQDPIVKCWGRNDYGQLGIGDALERGTSPSQMGDSLPTVDLGLSGVPQKLALGGLHSCVLLATGSVKCWGSNQYGQTGLSEGSTTNRGDGSNEMGNNLPNVNLGGSVLALDLTSGANHSCAVVNNNSVLCWGRNDSGQLGHDYAGANIASWGGTTHTMASLPASWVNNYSYYEGIALDNGYTCGVDRSQNFVTCWGLNAQSGLTYSTKYHDFTSAGGVMQLVAGTGFMCVLGNNNSLYCWGNDAWYTDRLNQTAFNYTAPNLGSPTATGISKIAAGENFLCALSTTNTIKCYGWNIASILGATGPGTYATAASAVTMTLPSGTPASISAGGAHACAMNTTGNLYCWGANNHGQVGDGTTANRNSPTLITTSVSKVSLGRNHSCAVLTSGAVKCWGENSFGQVGDATTTQRTSPTSITLGGTGLASDLSLGDNSSCAIMTDNKLRCWGSNSAGQLAIGSTTNATSPQTTNLGQDFRVFMAEAPKRGFHRCAIGWENSKQVPFQLKCWGDNSQGQLGYGDTTNRGGNAQYLGRAILPVVQNTTAALPTFNSVSDIVMRDSTYSTPSSSAVTVTGTVAILPTGVTGMTVKMWGAGGGGGSGGTYAGNNGGHGGFVSLSVPAAQLTADLSIYVAGKGQHGKSYSSSTGGSGGGSSSLLIGATLVSVAGGGGGGGGGGSSNMSCGTSGGGAGLTGANGSGYSTAGGATTAVNGAAGAMWTTGEPGQGGPGNADGGNATIYVGNVAGGLGYGQGGLGAFDNNGDGGAAGGGAGYYGGGGNSYYGFWIGYGCANGGGGSNYINSSVATSVANPSGTASSTPPAAATSDADYNTTAAKGGPGTTNTVSPAGDGYVVLRFY